MVEKGRDIISLTICSNIEKTIKDQVNQRFKDMPKHVSIFELFQYLDHTVEMNELIPNLLLNLQAPEVQPRPILARDPQSLTYYRTQSSIKRMKRSAEMHGVATVVESNEIAHNFNRFLVIEPKSKHQRTKFRTKRPAKLRQDVNEINEISEDDSGNETENVSTTDVSTPASSTTKRIGSKSNSSGMEGWKNSSVRPIVPINRGSHLTASHSGIMDVNGLRAFLDTIDMNSLARLFVNLDFLDSMSDDDSFTVGMDGTVLLNASPYVGSYGDGPTNDDVNKLKFPADIEHKTLEVLVGEFTPNSMLQQAHR
jgi:hypothetical protein